jgi:hypothetical protein
MNRLTEDVVMKFLPPGVEGGVSYGCGHKRTCVDSGTAHIVENSAALHQFFDFLPGFEEFMQKQSWGHLAASKLPGHYIRLIIFISTDIQSSSIELGRQYAWADYDVKDFQESPILMAGLKGKLNREGQGVVAQIRKPKRIGETFEEQFEELADVLLDRNS